MPIFGARLAAMSDASAILDVHSVCGKADYLVAPAPHGETLRRHIQFFHLNHNSGMTVEIMIRAMA